jgi:hypothetical protein
VALYCKPMQKEGHRRGDSGSSRLGDAGVLRKKPVLLKLLKLLKLLTLLESSLQPSISLSSSSLQRRTNSGYPCGDKGGRDGESERRERGLKSVGLAGLAGRVVARATGAVVWVAESSAGRPRRDSIPPSRDAREVVRRICALLEFRMSCTSVCIRRIAASSLPRLLAVAWFWLWFRRKPAVFGPVPVATATGCLIFRSPSQPPPSPSQLLFCRGGVPKRTRFWPSFAGGVVGGGRGESSLCPNSAKPVFNADNDAGGDRRCEGGGEKDVGWTCRIPRELSVGASEGVLMVGWGEIKKGG